MYRVRRARSAESQNGLASVVATEQDAIRSPNIHMWWAQRARLTSVDIVRRGRIKCVLAALRYVLG